MMTDIRELKEELLVTKRENAELRERINTQKQTIRAYRNECDELRVLLMDIWEMAWPEAPLAFESAFADRLQELGVEVDV